MSEPRFGDFQPPVDLTDNEWAALDAIRSTHTVARAALHLGIPEKRFRLLVRNAAEKLRIVASV